MVKDIFLEKYDTHERKKEMSLNGRISMLTVAGSLVVFFQTYNMWSLITAIIAGCGVAYNLFKLSKILKAEGME